MKPLILTSALTLAGLLGATGSAQAQAGAYAGLDPGGFCGQSVLSTSVPGSFTQPAFESKTLGFTANCMISTATEARVASLSGRSAGGNFNPWLFGGMSSGVASGDATWVEQINPVWGGFAALPGLATLRLTVQFEAGQYNGVTGTGFTNEFGFIPTSVGSARTDYRIDLSSDSRSTLAGSWWERSYGVAREVTGEWGRVTTTVDLRPLSVGGTEFGGRSMVVSMRVEHVAGFSFSSGFGTADARVGLSWLGVIGAEAFDSAGARLALPDGFALRLEGNDSGFDYWTAAAAAPIPEPGTWALMAGGLLALGARARRRAERPAS